MSKKYNLSSKSDMRKLERDLKKTVIDNTRNSIIKNGYDVNCPKCGNLIPSAKSGIVKCLGCGEEFNLVFNFKN